jgi:hypothetical protein
VRGVVVACGDVEVGGCVVRCDLPYLAKSVSLLHQVSACFIRLWSRLEVTTRKNYSESSDTKSMICQHPTDMLSACVGVSPLLAIYSDYSD